MRGPRPAFTSRRMVETERLEASHAALKLMTEAFGRTSTAGAEYDIITL